MDIPHEDGVGLTYQGGGENTGRGNREEESEGAISSRLPTGSRAHMDRSRGLDLRTTVHDGASVAVTN